MEKDTTEELNTRIAALRKAKKLHTEVENRLSSLVCQITTDFIPVKEPVGLAGGRNDLLLFEFSGKKVLFEIFASRGQVSRDLRILDKTKANIKIAVIVDREIDPKVFDAFVKENPEDNYPYIFISELFEEPPKIISLKLRQLIFGDDNAKFQRMLHARIERAKLASLNIFNEWQHEGIYVFTKDDIDNRNKNITFSQVFVTKILFRFIKMGINKERIKKLAKWLSDDDLIEFVLMKLRVGFNVLLYTDFEETFAVYSDGELADWLRIAYQLPKAFSYLSLNAVMYEVDEARTLDNEKFLDGEKPSIFLGASRVYNGEDGRIVDLSLPKHTSEINIILPMDNTRTSDEYMNMISIRDYGIKSKQDSGSENENNSEV